MSITVFNWTVKMQISNHKLQLVSYAFDDLTVRAIVTIMNLNNSVQYSKCECLYPKSIQLQVKETFY